MKNMSIHGAGAIGAAVGVGFFGFIWLVMELSRYSGWLGFAVLFGAVGAFLGAFVWQAGQP